MKGLALFFWTSTEKKSPFTRFLQETANHNARFCFILLQPTITYIIPALAKYFSMKAFEALRSG